MAKFALIVETDDEMDRALYGQPYDTEGFRTGLEAAFGQNGLQVLEIREVTSEQPYVVAPAAA